MQWWNDLVDTITSPAGVAVVTTVIAPFAAILTAGIVAAIIGRGSARRVIEWHDREAQASAVAALIGAGRRAALWGSLAGHERDHVDALASDAEIRVRMLPLAGSGAAADWAVHQLSEMKRDSQSFSFQSDQTLGEFRDRLIDWQLHPRRARRLFRTDLERWRYEQPDADAVLQQKQDEWSRQRSSDTAAHPTPATASTPVPFSSASASAGRTPTGSTALGSASSGSSGSLATGPSTPMPSGPASAGSAPTATALAPAGPATTPSSSASGTSPLTGTAAGSPSTGPTRTRTSDDIDDAFDPDAPSPVTASTVRQRTEPEDEYVR